jgi:hypothetical protein
MQHIRVSENSIALRCANTVAEEDYFLVRHNTRRLLTGTMAENKPNLFNLEMVRQKKLSVNETTITATFSHGMRPTIPEAVTQVARQLGNFCPPLEQEKEAKKYLWMQWDIMLSIATSPDVTSEIQNDLVEILQSLRQIAKGKLAIWVPVSIHQIDYHSS